MVLKLKNTIWSHIFVQAVDQTAVEFLLRSDNVTIMIYDVVSEIIFVHQELEQLESHSFAHQLA